MPRTTPDPGEALGRLFLVSLVLVSVSTTVALAGVLQGVAFVSRKIRR